MGSTLPGRHRFPRTCRQPGQPDRQVIFRIGRCPPHLSRRWESRSRQSALNLSRRRARAEAAASSSRTRVSLVTGCLCLDVVVSSSSVRRGTVSGLLRCSARASRARRPSSLRCPRTELRRPSSSMRCPRVPLKRRSSSLRCPRTELRRPSSWLSFPACDPRSPICETVSRRQCTGRIRCTRSTRSIGPAHHEIVIAARKVLGDQESRVLWQRSRAGQGGRQGVPSAKPSVTSRNDGEALGVVASLRRARLLGGARGPGA